MYWFQHLVVASFLQTLAPEVSTFFLRIGLVTIEDFAVLNVDEVDQKLTAAKIEFVKTKLARLKEVAQLFQQSQQKHKVRS